MKLNNFELVIELREYLRDQAATSYLTNYSLEDSKGNKATDFSEIKDLFTHAQQDDDKKDNRASPGEPLLLIRRGKIYSILKSNRKV